MRGRTPLPTPYPRLEHLLPSLIPVSAIELTQSESLLESAMTKVPRKKSYRVMAEVVILVNKLHQADSQIWKMISRQKNPHMMALTLAPHTFIMANGHQAAAAVLSGGQSWPARLVTPNISPSWSPQYFIILTSIFPHPGYSNISPSWSPPIFPHTSHLNISPTNPLQYFPTLVTPIFAHSSHLNIYHRFCFLPLLNFRQADAAQYRFVKGDFNWD